MRNTERAENSVYYYDDTESDTEHDDKLDQTMVSQEVSLLGRRYHDTCLQVDREMRKQPVMGVRARNEVVDWLVYKTDKGEIPSVSWDKIITEDAQKSDILNNNITKSDTFDDINMNMFQDTAPTDDSDYIDNELDENLNVKYSSDMLHEFSFPDETPETIHILRGRNNNTTEDTVVNKADVETLVTAKNDEDIYPIENCENYSLFWCSQDCFKMDSNCEHQRVVLPAFHSP